MFRLTRQTLVGRMALVQVVTTALALGGVLAVSFLVVMTLVGRERDRSLMSVAAATLGGLSELDDEADAKRIARELDQHRPAAVRVEAINATGETVASAGEGPKLKPAGDDTCLDQAGWRVCERSVGSLRVLIGSSRHDAEQLRNRVFGVLTLVSAFVLVLGGLASRAFAARGLRPLALMSRRLAGLKVGSGERLGAQAGAREVDDLATRFDELLGRVDEAVARERRFAAQASHELRTPLTVLRGELEELAHERVPSHAGVARALRSADNLVQLVESLLMFGRAEARFDPSELDVVNLADIVRRETSRLGGAMADRRISVDIPDEALVRGDDRLLGRTVSNLVDNALKYTPAGSPLELSLVTTTNALRLRLEDHGPGIPEAMRERIFEPFFRDPAARAGQPGHGLGLALARAVARAHGGDLAWVKTEGTGAAFELWLPSPT
jgi:signal transduction histidine kinase